MPAPDYCDLEDFYNQVVGRMAKGEREYGDKSFSASPAKIALELMEEAEDVAGWSYILWRRMVVMLKAARAMDATMKANAALIAEQELKLDALQEAIQGR